jgi:hypothetical protein
MIYSPVPYKDADTIESFPVESPVSYDDIRDKTSSLENRGSTDPTVPDSVLDCDCHVSVRCPSQFWITHSFSSLQADDNCILCEGGCKKWYHIWYVSYE